MHITPHLIAKRLLPYEQLAALRVLAKLDPSQADACHRALVKMGSIGLPGHARPRINDCHLCNGTGERHGSEYRGDTYAAQPVTDTCPRCNGVAKNEED